MSLWVDDPATPESVLDKCGASAAARRICGTGTAKATPRQMYASGFRIARLLGTDIIKSGKRIIPPKGDPQGQVRADGHLDLEDGKALSDQWAMRAVILGETETFR